MLKILVIAFAVLFGAAGLTACETVYPNLDVGGNPASDNQ